MEIVRLAVPIENDFRMVMRVPKEKLLEYINKYPTLKELKPIEDGRDVVIRNITPAALSILMKFISEDAIKLTSWKTALETYSAAQMYQIESLERICEEFISESKITRENVTEIHELARKLKLQQILKITSLFKKDNLKSRKLDVENTTVPQFSYCFIRESVLFVPFQVAFPLEEVQLSDMNDAFTFDLKNEIVLDAISGVRVLGIQIKLEPREHIRENSLQIYCDMSTDNENSIDVEETRCKCLDSLIIIVFRKEFLVHPGEKGTISVTIDDLKPVMCYGIDEETMLKASKFQVTYRSNRKISQSPLKRFFIDKLFFNYIDNNVAV